MHNRIPYSTPRATVAYSSKLVLIVAKPLLSQLCCKMPTPPLRQMRRHHAVRCSSRLHFTTSVRNKVYTLTKQAQGALSLSRFEVHGHRKEASCADPSYSRWATHTRIQMHMQQHGVRSLIVTIYVKHVMYSGLCDMHCCVL